LNLTILVDKQEVRSKIPEMLKEKGVNVIIESLKIGDYLCSDRTCIERKVAKDFVASVKTKRLFRQMADLKQYYEKPLLLIEGYNLYEVMGVYPKGIRGALSMIAVGLSIPVLFSKNKGDTVEFLITIAKQEQLIGREVSLYPKKRAITESEEIERILEAFPKIGPAITKQLLKRYKSIGEVFKASVEDLKRVPLIGEKRAKLIKSILDREYKPGSE